MITIKTLKEIECMKKAGRIAAEAQELARELVQEGVTTAYIDREIERFIRSRGAVPSFLHYNGFPKSVCISVNDEVVHGIPGHRKLQKGDIVSIDIGTCIDGYHSDCARTFAVGEISPEATRLIRVTEECFFHGMRQAVAGNRISDISHAVQAHAEANGYSVVRDLVGHGVGKNLHEEPEVPNFGRPHHGVRLVPGMTLAIEPMINEGTFQVKVLSNDWTVVTRDGKLSAHYENTVLITQGDPVILSGK
jgi:methionyl aminopeptidase